MKKITTLLMLLMAATMTFGQPVDGEYFATTNWWGPPSDVDFSAEAANESQVVIPMINPLLDGEIDLASLLVADDITMLWDRIGDANLIAGQTDEEVTSDPFDLDENAEGTFGAAWKAFYDSESLFVIFKFVDTEGLADGGRSAEIALQTREHERYEAGWQAASADTTGVGYYVMNDQYGAYMELGAMKLVFDKDGVNDNSSSTGSTGEWAPAIGGNTVGEIINVLETDGTLWYVVQIEFGDLNYYIDEWGTNEAANVASMDPAVETIISFEPKSVAVIGETTYQAWWHGVNNAYVAVYYQGKLEFGTNIFNPVGIGSVSTVLETKAYIYEDMLRLKGFDNAVDLEVYSIIGQKVLAAENVAGELNVSELNDGVYIVKIKNTKEAYKVVK